MAELVLTDEEKSAALWSDLDDEALGKMLRKKIIVLQDAAQQMNRTFEYAAALLFVCGASEVGENSVCMTLDGVTQDGRKFGDWVISATRVA